MTGASGLLGRRVTGRLRQAGADVTTSSRSGANDSVMADLAWPEPAAALVAAGQPDVVLHLAGGQVAPGSNVYAANVLPTVHLLNALADRAPDAYVMVAGSAAEYGDGGGTPLAETSPCHPVTDYGRAKLAQTQVAQAIAADRGLRLTVVRPFNVVADDLPARSALGNIRRQLLTGTGSRRRVVCGRTDLRRDFVTADTVADLLSRLAVQRPDVAVLNLCSGTSVSLDDVIAGLAAALGVQVDVHADPQLLAIPAAQDVVGDARRLADLGHRLDGTVPSLVAALITKPTRAT